MLRQKIFFLLLSIILFSFSPTDNSTFTFAYPKRKGTDITLSSNHFKKFTKEWRGSDYYYYSEAEGFICSVLYYKLNDKEQEELIELPKKLISGADISPAYPYSYFKNYSNLKDMEINDSSWGKAEDDFMFRQNDVIMEGTAFSQKHMYGYAMAGKDLFINVHLSKVSCSPTDSIDMINILSTLTFTNKATSTNK